MKIDTSSNNKLWKDRVNLELGIAVSHSFKKAGCVIIDQHSLVSNKFKWIDWMMNDFFLESAQGNHALVKY